LYRQAGRFGDAVRVLNGDSTREGRAAQAEAREAGDDLVGAARLYEEAGKPDRAVLLFMQAGEFLEAARCLRAWMGDDAIEDPRLGSCLRQAGEYEQLVR